MPITPLGRDLPPLKLVSFSLDGKILATCLEEHGDGRQWERICFWNMVNGREVKSFKSTRQSVTMDLSPDGKMLVFGSKGGTVERWDSDSGFKLLLDPPSPRMPRTNLTFSLDGKCIAALSEIGVW